MVSSTYGIKPDFSSLIYTIASIGFVLGAPVVMQLRERKILRRRVILLLGYCLMGTAMIFRTGNIMGNLNLWMVYIC